MMLRKRHSKEDSSAVLDDLKRSFSSGKSQAATQIWLCFKKVFQKQPGQEVYPGVPQLSKMGSFAVTINGF